jgi:hypothetical protein
MRFHSELAAGYPSKNNMLRFDMVHKIHDHGRCNLEFVIDGLQQVVE